MFTVRVARNTVRMAGTSPTLRSCSVSKNFGFLGTVALSFLYDKYYPTID
jgi:hypothetical protein